jgi:hypothetical protein
MVKLMSQPTDTFPEKLSNLLQASWDSEATGLQLADIAWSHDKYETLNTIAEVTQKVIVSTYNPPNPVQVELLSKETNFVHETVLIDVILHTAAFGSTDSCITARENIRKLVLAVIHAIQLNTGASLAGADAVRVDGEYIRGELPDLQREAFKTVVSYFEVLPS